MKWLIAVLLAVALLLSGFALHKIKGLESDTKLRGRLLTTAAR